ncbi:MAG: VWA domain-containing protein [Actinomycetia bacterium]|nr:VWA domain-containing protein [Actinomycetes bacterium]
MPDPTYTDITMLLDRSGSMQSIKTDIEGGFDAFMAEQRKQPGTCRVSLSQFDTEYESVYTAKDLADVPPLDLCPRDATALLDAIGQAVRDTQARLGAMPEAERPGAVIVGIMTDGLENSSREMTYPAVKALIEAQETRHGWIFTYLGANQDAIEEGARLGIDHARAMTFVDTQGASALGGLSGVTSRVRSAVAEGAAPPVVLDAGRFTDEDRAAALGMTPPDAE